MEKLNVVIASDSFKGSLSSDGVAQAMIKGFKKTQLEFNFDVFQIADGGEGTVEAVTQSLNGEIKEYEVLDVFRRKTKAILGVLDEKTCILETASPCGLDKIDSSELNPMKATSFGLGQMIKNALDSGFETIYIGLGGSSVNDGGIGLAIALGVEILNKDNQRVSDGAVGLSEVELINLSNIDKRLADRKIILLSDVKNPLIGKDGATAIYGPQKGVKEEEVELIDSWMKSFGEKLSKESGKDILNAESAGAAGGLGAMLIAITNAEVKSGIEAIVELLGIEDAIKKSDLVFTGEGRMDGQSLNGKAPIGIAQIAKKYDKPVIAIVGSKGKDCEAVLDHGIDLVLDIVDKPMDLDEAIAKADELVSKASYSAMKLYINWKIKFCKTE